jgi:hypothetical protein
LWKTSEIKMPKYQLVVLRNLYFTPPYKLYWSLVDVEFSSREEIKTYLNNSSGIIDSKILPIPISEQE